MGWLRSRVVADIASQSRTTTLDGLGAGMASRNWGREPRVQRQHKSRASAFSADCKHHASHRGGVDRGVSHSGDKANRTTQDTDTGNTTAYTYLAHEPANHRDESGGFDADRADHPAALHHRRLAREQRQHPFHNGAQITSLGGTLYRAVTLRAGGERYYRISKP